MKIKHISNSICKELLNCLICRLVCMYDLTNVPKLALGGPSHIKE